MKVESSLAPACFRWKFDMHKLLQPMFGVIAVASFAAGCQTETVPPATTATPATRSDVASTAAAVSVHNDADGYPHGGDVQEDHGDADAAAAMAALGPEDRKGPQTPYSVVVPGVIVAEYCLVNCTN